MIDDARLAELEAAVEQSPYDAPLLHDIAADLLAELRKARKVQQGLREHYMRVVTSMGEDAKWCARYDFDNERATNRRKWIAGHERDLDALITKLQEDV